MKIVIDQCSGIAPRIPPARLTPAGAQIARNVDVRRQTLQPLRSAGSIAVTLPFGTKTIYKWGGTLSERMWFAWAEDVDVCRGQIAGDDLEWTIFTGDGYPKITNANMYGLASPPEPAPYAPYEPYEPFVPPSEPSPTGSKMFGDEYEFSTDAGVNEVKISWFVLPITPLEDAFALAPGSVSISGGALTTDFPGADFSALNAAINGTYSSLAAFESAVTMRFLGYDVSVHPRSQGMVLIIYHGHYEETHEVISVASTFTATWGA